MCMCRVLCYCGVVFINVAQTLQIVFESVSVCVPSLSLLSVQCRDQKSCEQGRGGTCGEVNYRARMNWVSYSKNYKYLPGVKHHQPLLHTANQPFYLENYFTKQFLQFSKLSVIRQECRNHLISQQKPPNNSKKRNWWAEAPQPEYYLLRITSQVLY